jgi:hypothetical protein
MRNLWGQTVKFLIFIIIVVGRSFRRHVYARWYSREALNLKYYSDTICNTMLVKWVSHCLPSPIVDMQPIHFTSLASRVANIEPSLLSTKSFYDLII